MNNGVEVATGVSAGAHATRLNQVFFHYIQTQRPYVVMKVRHDAGRQDRHTAPAHPSGSPAKQPGDRVQQDRHRYRGIMAGVGTVLADDPLLTCRHGRRPEPHPDPL